MSAKNVILKRKIGTEIFELLPKTTGENVQVVYGASMTLASALASIYTDVEAWNTFKKDVDFAGTDSALDTLRELIDMISKEDQAGSIAATLAELRQSITDNVSTINERIDGVEEAYQQADTAIGERIDGVDQSITAINERIDGVEEAYQQADTALGERIDSLEATTAASSQVYVAAAQPESLSENDLWIEVVEEPAEG